MAQIDLFDFKEEKFMKKFLHQLLIIICFTSLLLLTSCTKKTQTQWLNTNIKGNYLPQKPSLKDDFYQNVNYEKLIAPSNENVVNEGNANNAYAVLREQMSIVLKDANSTNPEHQILHKFYNQFIDWESRNADSFNPVLPYIKKINNVKTLEDFEALFSDDILRYFMPVYLNTKYSSSLTINYFELFEKKDIAFQFFTKMLIKSGLAKQEAENKIQNLISFEEKIILDDEKKSSSYSYAGIDDLFVNFPIKKLLENLDLPQELTTFNCYYFVEYANRISLFDSFYNLENLENLKNIVLCKLLLDVARVLDKESFELYLEFTKQLYGANNYENDDYEAVNYLNDNFPFMLGKIWLEEYFSNETKQDVENLITKIMEEYKKEIQNWNWISQSMKYSLNQLIDNTSIIVGPTEGYRDYSNIQINKSTLCESALSIIKYNKQDYFNAFLSENNSTKGILPPQIYNAFNNVLDFDNVSISVLAGFLCGNKYSIEMPVEEKFGKLGVIISHEISHIFVTTQKGNTFLSTIWKNEDLVTMQNKLQPLVDLMNSMKVLDGKVYNGNEKIKEMGADYFGMKVILSISKSIPDFNYDLFFKTYTETYYRKATLEQIESLFNDSHPLDYLRVNLILPQFDEFYKTYRIKKGDGMYLSPKQRVKS